MKPKKAADQKGAVAEMMMTDCAEVQDAILNLFNDVLACREVPTAWRSTRLDVIFEKGDPRLPRFSAAFCVAGSRPVLWDSSLSIKLLTAAATAQKTTCLLQPS